MGALYNYLTLNKRYQIQALNRLDFLLKKLLLYEIDVTKRDHKKEEFCDLIPYPLSLNRLACSGQVNLYISIGALNLSSAIVGER